MCRRFFAMRHGVRIFLAGGPAGEARVWCGGAEAVRRWKDGTTGIPFVDASMRELLHTGGPPCWPALDSRNHEVVRHQAAWWSTMCLAAACHRNSAPQATAQSYLPGIKLMECD